MKGNVVREFLKEEKIIEKIQNDRDYRESKSFRNNLLEFIKAKKTSEWCDIKKNISSKYSVGLFILQAGVLEDYTGIGKVLKNTVSFCKNDLETWYSSGNYKAQELKTIFSAIFKIPNTII